MKDRNESQKEIYFGNNRFNGTRIPPGYEAVYIPRTEEGIPDSLQLKKKSKTIDSLDENESVSNDKKSFEQSKEYVFDKYDKLFKSLADK